MAPSKAELDLVKAKAKCFRVCGALDPAVAADRALAEAVHEPHKAELEAAYLAFQEASGLKQASNPASGTTNLEAHLVVESN